MVIILSIPQRDAGHKSWLARPHKRGCAAARERGLSQRVLPSFPQLCVMLQRVATNTPLRHCEKSRPQIRTLAVKKQAFRCEDGNRVCCPERSYSCGRAAIGEHNANVNVGEQHSPLVVAVQGGFDRLVILLLRRGAYISERTGAGTALAMAIDTENIDKVEKLLQNGTDPSIPYHDDKDYHDQYLATACMQPAGAKSISLNLFLDWGSGY